MTPNLSVGGEIISVSDAIKLVDSLYAHAYELAGRFYENNRSEKFRINWPNAYDYAEANKRTFVQQARADFTQILGNEKTPPDQQRRIYLALLVERAFSAGLEKLGHETDTRLQIKTDSEQFVGDKRENASIVETYGKQPNYRAKVLASAAKFGRMH